MVTEADKGETKIKPTSTSKLHLLEWIKSAQDIVESKGSIMEKSFSVVGITNKST